MWRSTHARIDGPSWAPGLEVRRGVRRSRSRRRRSSAQPSTSSAAACAWEPTASVYEVIPPITRATMRTPSATNARRTRPAPPARGKLCRRSRPRSGGATAAADESYEHGLGDLGRCAEAPDEADDEHRDADEEPRRDAEIAQPARCREDGRERAELSGVDLEDRLLVCIRRRSLFSAALKDGHAHLGRVGVAGLLVTSWDQSGRDRPSHRPKEMTRALRRANGLRALRFPVHGTRDGSRDPGAGAGLGADPPVRQKRFQLPPSFAARPSLTAQRAACVRELRPSLRRMFDTCVRAVRSLIPSSVAIALLEWPSPRSRRIVVGGGEKEDARDVAGRISAEEQPPRAGEARAGRMGVERPCSSTPPFSMWLVRVAP